jgi:hypothetical protein
MRVSLPIAVALTLTTVIASACVQSSASPSPGPDLVVTFPTITVSNGSDLDISVLVNGGMVETVGGDEDRTLNLLQRPPWEVVLRSPSGRELLRQEIRAGTVGQQATVDLPCGRVGLVFGEAYPLPSPSSYTRSPCEP